VACNRSLKFDALVDRAAEVGADLVATGHYVRRRDGRDGRPRLLRAIDRRKDQTYFLFNLHPSRIARALFPVGLLTKEEVRARARAYGLPVADKPESQEICFIPDGNTGAFLAREMGDRAPGPGEIVDEAGNALGRHLGIHRYTVGQRRGLGLPGGPWYVLRLDPATGRVVVGPDVALRRETFKVSGVHWIAGRPPRTARVSVKIRHAHPEAEALLRFLSADSAEVTLAAPARAVAPGQAAVFYRGDLLLGGGWIA
jgi:tRNA-specific 2-thiouridylase